MQDSFARRYWSNDSSISSRRWRESFVANKIAQNRKSFLVKTLTKAAFAILDAYENSNHRLEANGELVVLNTISKSAVDVVVDAGSNIGDWTDAALNAISGAKIFCADIEPEMRALLNDRFEHEDRVRVLEYGFGSYSGEVSYRFAKKDPGHTSMVVSSFASGATARPGTIKHGDSFKREYEIDYIDLLKIDSEGSEYSILEGFSGALQAQRIKVVQFEYGLATALAGCQLRDFYELLLPLGYTIGKIYPDGVDFRSYDVEHETFRGCNYLAVEATQTKLIDNLSA